MASTWIFVDRRLRFGCLDSRLGALIRKLGEIVLLQLEAATGTISTVLMSKRLRVARHANNVSKVQRETSKLKYNKLK